MLRFNIKCVCDTIILAGKSRWLQNCTRHYSPWYGFSSNTYLVPANQKQRHKYDTHRPPPTMSTKALSTYYKFYPTGFKVMCKSLTANTIDGIFRPHIGLFFPPEVIPVNFSAIIIKLTFGVGNCAFKRNSATICLISIARKWDKWKHPSTNTSAQICAESEIYYVFWRYAGFFGHFPAV